MEPFQGGTDAKSALADVRAAHPTLARDGARRAAEIDRIQQIRLTVVPREPLLGEPGLTDLKIVADEIADGVGDYFSLTFAVRKDSPIENVDGLRNKVVATNAIGAGAYIPLEVMLRQNGLLPKRDYRVVET
jgi:ABC-type phosphate/phosphonate transport system substrate-binding protein